MQPLFVVGDVHGHRDVLVGLLRDAGLVDAADGWVGADATLWLVGDLVDRGPDGIATIDLVRRLEQESKGGVRCLLGNHEAFLLSVHLVGAEDTGFPGTTFEDVWLANGNVPRRFARFTCGPFAIVAQAKGTQYPPTKALILTFTGRDQ